MTDLSHEARIHTELVASRLQHWLHQRGESLAIAREAWLGIFDQPVTDVLPDEKPKFDIDRDGPPAFRG